MYNLSRGDELDIHRSSLWFIGVQGAVLGVAPAVLLGIMLHVVRATRSAPLVKTAVLRHAFRLARACLPTFFSLAIDKPPPVHHIAIT